MNSYLDVAIGLSFVYLLASLICSTVNELIAWALGLRAKTLRAGIDKLLHDPAVDDALKSTGALARRFHEHPLIQRLGEGASKPSYIPARTFTSALLHILAVDFPAPAPVPALAPAPAAGPPAASVAIASVQGASAVMEFQAGAQPPAGASSAAVAALDLAALRAMIGQLPAGSQLQSSLNALLDSSVKTVEQARTRIEQWFDDSMDRVSGDYKRTSQKWVLGIAVVATLALDLDSGRIADRLSHDSALRASVVAAAQEYARTDSRLAPMPGNQGNPPPALAQIKAAQQEIEGLDVPIGWQTAPWDADGKSGLALAWRLAGVFAGLLVSALAISLGAPFWFDMLSRIVNLRAEGDVPEKSRPAAEQNA